MESLELDNPQTAPDGRTFGEVFLSARGKLCELDTLFDGIVVELQTLFEIAQDDDNATLLEGIQGRVIRLQNLVMREISDHSEKNEIIYSLGHVADKVSKDSNEYLETLFIPSYRESVQYICKEDFTEELFQEWLTKFKRDNNFVEKERLDF